MSDDKPKVTYRRITRKAPVDLLATEPEPPAVEQPAQEITQEVKPKRGRKKKVAFADPLAESQEPEEDDFLADLKVQPTESQPAPEESQPVEVPLPPSPVSLGRDPFVPLQQETSLPIKRGGRGPSKSHSGIDSFSDLFSNSSPTPLYGKDRRAALMKLKEYKHLFPDQLKDLKLKPNPSLADIQDALDEAEVITSAGGIHTMLNEAVLSAVQIVEGVSSNLSAVDVSGTTEALRNNPDFLCALKLCWIKYRVFTAIPPEVRVGLIISATMTHQLQVNRKKREINSYLSQPL